jgi:hypothetical protein
MPHQIRFALEAAVGINRNALHLQCGFYASLLLLNDVPSLVRQMLLLAWSDVDVRATGIGVRSDSSRFR